MEQLEIDVDEINIPDPNQLTFEDVVKANQDSIESKSSSDIKLRIKRATERYIERVTTLS